MEMVKHHLPPGLDIKVGDTINGWTIAFIEPRKYKFFPVEIKENEIPDQYFFIVTKRDETTGEFKNFPGFVPYTYLFERNFSEFMIECIEKMEGRV